MPLNADTAIVTAVQVAQITREANLALPDEGNATLAALLPEATNYLRRWATTQKGVDPADITNDADFRPAAAYWVAMTFFSSLPQGDEENARKVELYERRLAEELRITPVQTVRQNARLVTGRGLPRVLNLDSVPALARPRDNRRGNERPPWLVK